MLKRVIESKESWLVGSRGERATNGERVAEQSTSIRQQCLTAQEAKGLNLYLLHGTTGKGSMLYLPALLSIYSTWSKLPTQRCRMVTI